MPHHVKHRHASPPREPGNLYTSVTGQVVTLDGWRRFRGSLALLREAELLVLLITDDIPKIWGTEFSRQVDRSMKSKSFERFERLLQELPIELRPLQLVDPELQKYRTLGLALRLTGSLIRS